MTVSSRRLARCSATWSRAGAGPVLPVADRRPARRQRPQRLVQLGVRAPLRRHVRVPDRGHRRRPQHRGGLRRRCSTSMRWLGIDWDEGPGGRRDRTGRTCSPSASTSTPTSRAGCAPPARPTTATARRRSSRRAARPAKAEHKTSGYDGHCRELTARAGRGVRGARAASRCSGSGCRTGRSRSTDLVRGEITFLPEHVPDFVLVRANGHPLYTLVNPVDDALMEITHVLRGEDLLSSTPRQIALYDALPSSASARARPAFGHLPYRDGRGQQASSPSATRGRACSEYIERGFLPEGMLNYLALLGWAIAEDRDVFTMAEMVEAFDIRRVNPNPARFDLQEVRGDQRRAPAGADRRGPHRADDPVPAARRGARRRGHRRAARAARPRPPRWCTSGWPWWSTARRAMRT